MIVVFAMAMTAPPSARVAGAESPTPQNGSRPIQPSPGDKLLVQAANQLERRASLSARLRHQIFLGDNSLYGVGSYWQQGSGDELRVRLELQIAGQNASLLQISNSRFLWIDRQLPTGRNVSRIDLRQLRADPILSAVNLDELEPGSAGWSSVPAELFAHCGGLTSLLASLSENFSFLPPQAMRLAAQAPKGSQPANVPVFAVVGHWKPEKLASLLSLNSQPSTLNNLPDRIPQEVLLLVGQADMFPYRIEYRRLETPLAANRDATPIPYQLSTNPLVVLELADVAFDVPIAPGQFDYTPGDADWVDQTTALLERLRRQRDVKLAERARAGRPIEPNR